MIAKSQIKLITSLSKKKYRQEHGLFVVEGVKGIQEMLHSRFKLHSLYSLAENSGAFDAESIEVDSKTLHKISFLKTPQKALALFKIPEHTVGSKFQGLTLVLDDVRDPGNLGTIIRWCDWFSIKTILCSPQTVDCYNSKVVQATMGSLSRVQLIYENLESILKNQDLPVYGAFMDGKNVYKESLPQNAFLILGNEAGGISESLNNYIHHRLSIPQSGGQTAESLNVAIAGAILVSQFRSGNI